VGSFSLKLVADDFRFDQSSPRAGSMFSQPVIKPAELVVDVFYCSVFQKACAVLIVESDSLWIANSTGEFTWIKNRES
jgi:hypothetical protein